jgi:cytochrome c oxidase assembly protein subunit 15
MGLQFALGLAALIVMLYEQADPGLSLAPVLLTVGHLVVGALLFGMSIVTTLLVARPSLTESTNRRVRSVESEPVLANSS